MATDIEKREKVLCLNNRNADRITTQFTGRVIIDWRKGEPMKQKTEVTSDIK